MKKSFLIIIAVFSVFLLSGCSTSAKGNLLEINVSLSTVEKTRQNVTITVTVNGPEVSKVGYVYSKNEISPFTTAPQILADEKFTVLSKDENGNYIITASQNGLYSIAAVTVSGESKYIEEVIKNINEADEDPIRNLGIHYDEGTKTITVQWDKTFEKDKVFISYSKAGNMIVSDVEISESTYQINNIESDDDNEYVFSVYTKDLKEVKSTSEKVSCIPSEIICTKSISLNNYHISIANSDHDVYATAFVSNIEKLKDGSDVKFVVIGPYSREEYEADINEEDGTVTAILNVRDDNPPTNGIDYKVYVKYNDVADTVKTAVLCVCSGPILTNFSVGGKKDGIFTNDTLFIHIDEVIQQNNCICAEFSGINIDTFSSITYSVYDDIKNNSIFSDKKINLEKIQGENWLNNGSNIWDKFVTELEMPDTPSTYSIYLYLDGKTSGIYRTVWVYKNPEVNNISIPKASLNKNVKATITGSGFMTPIFDKSVLSFYCTANSSIVQTPEVTVKDDNTAYVELKNPGRTGNFTVTVKGYPDSQNNTSGKSGTFVVVDYSDYSVGDVLLKDGSRIKVQNVGSMSNTQKLSAIAVLFGIDEYGVPVGWLGKYNSQGNDYFGSLRWEPIEREANYRDSFEYPEIQCSSSNGSEININETSLSGDADGSDNWAYICQIEKEEEVKWGMTYEYTKEANIYFPAFNYVNLYSSTYSLPSSYKNGWYMPAMAELVYIYNNRFEINESLTTIGGTIIPNRLWSSNQYFYRSCWSMNMYTGIISTMSCNSTCYVCVIRHF